MSDESGEGVHWSFWLVGALCFIWNVMGVMAYMQEMNPESLAMLPADHRAMIEMRPAWATGAFAVAVWGGVLGCFLLLVRKAIAQYVLIASLLGVVVQLIYNLVIADSTLSYGPFEIAMVILIPGTALFLVWYARYATDRKWIS